MKLATPFVFAFLLTGLGHSAAFADDSTGDYEANRIDTLHYRAATGIFQLTWSVDAPLQDQSLEYQNGNTYYDHYYSFLNTSATVAYGITDRFLISAQMSYLFDGIQARSQDSSGNTWGFTYGGMSNPNIHLSYRYWGELTGRFFASAYLNYSPNLGPNKEGFADRASGNNLSGHTTTEVGTNAYWVSGQHEWEAVVAAQTAGATTWEDTINETNTGFADAWWRYYATATYRYHLMSGFYLGASAVFNLPYNVTSHYPGQSPATDEKQAIGLEVVPSVSLGWHVTPKSVLQASLNYESYSTQTTSANFNTITNNYQRQYLTVGGSVEF